MENLDVTTVIFAVVAIFVVFKLRSVLGTRTGNERRPPEPPPPPAPAPAPPGAAPAPPAPNVISLGVRRAAQTAPAPAPDRWRPYAEAGTALAEGLDSIAAVEPQFDPTAFLNGARVNVNLAPLTRRRLTITGSTLRSRGSEFKAEVAQALRTHVWPLLAAGRVRAVIERTFPLAQAADAHRLLEAGEHVGKIVLTA